MYYECKPVVAVTFAPVYTLFTPSAYGVLLALVDVMLCLGITSTTMRRTPYADGVNNIWTGANVTATTGLHTETTGIETKQGQS
jgi:hypothetical protein